MTEFDFAKKILTHSLDLKPLGIQTLQVNITKMCNQACTHCHVDASPKRTEQMKKETIDKCIEILSAHNEIKNVDITGGAPELNPHFDYFVKTAKEIGKHIIVRHNFTITLDGNPQTGESKKYLPEFFAKNEAEVIASLPYYREYFTDKQRGRGVFQKSIESMRMLNENGYGDESGKLKLNLVYNPAGAFLPASQESIEKDFKEKLWKEHRLKFNKLYTITNMPIHRFKEQLERLGAYEEYMEKLVNSFNPAAAENVMCRTLLSIGYDGKLYDCDFNQMLEMQILNHKPLTVFNFNYGDILKRSILFGSHCFGCTAGSGSSCIGATAG